MGAAGFLGVLFFFWSVFVFFVFLDDGVGWGEVGWDVNVM